ncbi:uncharacterized protein BJX67DRAFT_333073 [Aspergillus lucknowensis]|uniref:Uncharacterized protein n=1 Tax=Aspergillus lucknowensis TaxID=176173 RepID=A0ABR4LYE6_9EURO
MGEWGTLEIVGEISMVCESFMKHLAFTPKLEVLMGQSHTNYELVMGADGKTCGGSIISWIQSVLDNRPVFRELEAKVSLLIKNTQVAVGIMSHRTLSDVARAYRIKF